MQLEDVIPGIGPNDVLEFAQTPDPVNWLEARFADAKKDEFPGLDTLKMIEREIIRLPYEISESLNDHAKIKALIDQIKETRFYFPLLNLWDEKEKVFTLNQRFEDEAFEHFSAFAETKEQIELVNIVNDLASALNKLAGFGLLNFRTSGLHKLGFMSDFFDVDKGSETPLKTSRRLFWRPALGRFRSRGYKEALPFSRLFTQ